MSTIHIVRIILGGIFATLPLALVIIFRKQIWDAIGDDVREIFCGLLALVMFIALLACIVFAAGCIVEFGQWLCSIIHSTK
jgi:hypothetical protein